MTWYSIAVALHNITGARSRKDTYEKLYGAPYVGSHACVPDDLAAFDLCRNVFGGDRYLGHRTRSVEDVYWRIVNESEWNPWIRKRKPLAWCALCMEEDLAAHGWAAWHVMHQVPFVHDCLVHRSPLLTHCVCCDQVKDDGRQWLLPSDVCDVCGARAFAGHIVASSEGYSALLDNTRAFCTGVLMPFDEAAWAKNMSTVAERATTSCTIDEVIRRQLELRWGVQSVDQIPALLRFEERANWFAWAFDWKTPQSQLVRLLLYDALVSVGLWDCCL